MPLPTLVAGSYGNPFQQLQTQFPSLRTRRTGGHRMENASVSESVVVPETVADAHGHGGAFLVQDVTPVLTVILEQRREQGVTLQPH